MTGITSNFNMWDSPEGLTGVRLAKKARQACLSPRNRIRLALVVQLIAGTWGHSSEVSSSLIRQMGAGVPALGLFPEGGLQQPIEFPIIPSPVGA